MNEHAAETAKAKLAETKRWTTMIECHRVLGIVAARAGDSEGAEAAFMAGLEVAREEELCLLEMLCARDLLQFVPGQESRAEALIQTACEGMGKPQSDFEELLVKRRDW